MRVYRLYAGSILPIVCCIVAPSLFLPLSLSIGVFIMFMFDFASSVRLLIAAAAGAAADAIVVVILLLHIIIAGIELLWFERKRARARAILGAQVHTTLYLSVVSLHELVI